MCEYIFTELEKQIFEEYVKTGIKRDGLRTLFTRIRQHEKIIQEDYDLLNQARTK